MTVNAPRPVPKSSVCSIARPPRRTQTNKMDDEPSSPTRTPGAPAGRLTIDVLDTDRLLDASDLSWLIDATNRVCAQLPNTGEVRVCIVADDRMRDAHQRYSALDTTTDVLTFDLAHDQPADDSKVLDTDLFVCADEASRQAQNREHDTKHELLLYIIHGVLHCLGHNDQDNESFQKMHTREDELLAGAGIGALFHTDTPTSTGDQS